MAKIVEFSSRPGGSVAFYEWISNPDNIAGTFLEGCTFDRIEYSQNAPYLDMIFINKARPATQSFIIQCSGSGCDTNWTRYAVAYILASDTSKALKWASDGDICWCTVNGIALCKNGMFIRMYYTVDTSGGSEIPGANCYTCLLTVDDNGNFIFARTTEDLAALGSIPTRTLPPASKDFYLSSFNSEQIYVKPNTWVQEDVTSIYRASVANTEGIISAVPNLFIADMTQTATADYAQSYLYSVELNRIKYLTNGIWYVKDE